MIVTMHKKIISTLFAATLAFGCIGIAFGTLAASAYPDGTLIRPDGEVKVYYIQNGAARWIISPDVFNENKLNWSTIKPIRVSDFQKLPGGEDLTGNLSGTTVTVDLSPALLQSNMPKGIDFNLLWDAWQTIQQNYPNSSSLDPQKLVQGATDGLLKAVGDPYTEYFNPADAQTFSEDIQGEFYGIGAELGYQNGIVVVAPLHGLPAEQAGIHAGDKILKIGDASTADMSIDKAITLIRGEQGTTVTLTVQRTGTNDPLVFTVTRSLVKINTVELIRKTNEISVIKINNFFGSVEEDFNNTVAQAQKDGMRRLIIDLRDDPGGLFNAAIDIASEFIPQGKLLVSADFGAGNQKQDITSSGNAPLANIPLVVLVNGGSASASEILAGALRDSHSTTLLGEKTFGKGSVQQVFQFPGGSSAKVTIAHWITPSGEAIDGVGITPAVVVPLTVDDANAGRDPQLDRATQIVQGLSL